MDREVCDVHVGYPHSQTEKYTYSHYVCIQYYQWEEYLNVIGR